MVATVKTNRPPGRLKASPGSECLVSLQLTSRPSLISPTSHDTSSSPGVLHPAAICARMLT